MLASLETRKRREVKAPWGKGHLSWAFKEEEVSAGEGWTLWQKKRNKIAMRH